MVHAFKWRAKSFCMLFVALWVVLTGAVVEEAMADEPPIQDRLLLPSFQVLIDVGHGGIDGGAVYGGVMEKDVNLAVARRLYDRLNREGIAVILNRDHDYALSDHNRWLANRSRHKRDLAQRLQLSREVPIRVFISLHVNAIKNENKRGPLVLHQANEQSAFLAKYIQRALNRQQGTSRLPKLGKTYYLLNRVESPAVIVEMGFITNMDDRSMLTDPRKQTAIASAIAEGIKQYLLDNDN